jgi:hypothetical protein
MVLEALEDKIFCVITELFGYLRKILVHHSLFKVVKVLYVVEVPRMLS